MIHLLYYYFIVLKMSFFENVKKSLSLCWRDFLERNESAILVQNNKKEFLDTLIKCSKSEDDIEIKKGFKLIPYNENAFSFDFTSFEEFNIICQNSWTKVESITYNPSNIRYSYNKYYIIRKVGKNITIILGD